MGACLVKPGGDDNTSDGPTPRDTSRKRARTTIFGPGNGRRPSNRSCTERRASSHHMPVPDFGISSMYRVLELLGEGGTGQTWLCQDLRTHRRVAIKFIPRPLAKVLVPMVSQEIQLQAQLSEGHLGLVRVESALLSKSHLGLVMEYVDGGTLTQYVTKRAASKGERGGLHLTEDEARYFFRQLIAAVEYLHLSHVAHRDLKMCNVVLTQRRPPTLKLCDFGFAKGWDDSSVMATSIGTPVYMSPQLILSKSEGKTYSATAADVWACGVMMFAMLLGRFPYDHVGHPDPNSSGAHIEVFAEQMKASNGDWRNAPRVAPHIALLSDECKDLLGKMLTLDEKLRITIPDIRKHVWFTTELPPYLDEAVRDFEDRQARLAKAMEAATEEQIKRRNKTVHDLIVLAGQPYDAIEPLGGEHRRIASSAISAIFECGTECEAGSTAGGSFCAGTHSRTLSPMSPAAADVDTPEKDTCCGGGGGKPLASAASAVLTAAPSTALASMTSAALTAAGSSVDGRRLDKTVSRVESNVVIIDLAAVTKRTKSDGFVLMASYFPDGADGATESCGRDCACDTSEGSDPANGERSSNSGGDGGGVQTLAGRIKPTATVVTHRPVATPFSTAAAAMAATAGADDVNAGEIHGALDAGAISAVVAVGEEEDAAAVGSVGAAPPAAPSAAAAAAGANGGDGTADDDEEAVATAAVAGATADGTAAAKQSFSVSDVVHEDQVALLEPIMGPAVAATTDTTPVATTTVTQRVAEAMYPAPISTTKTADSTYMCVPVVPEPASAGTEAASADAELRAEPSGAGGRLQSPSAQQQQL